MRVIDCHSHFFSRPFFDALADLSPLPGDREAKLHGLVQKTGIELPSPDLAEHLQRWLGELDRHGVEHLVTFASLPQEIPAVAEAAARAQGRITAVALVDPRQPDAAEGTRRLLAEQGYNGVLVFPAMHHVSMAGAEARSLLAVLAQHRAPIYVHCGMLVVRLRDLLAVPRPYDLRFANPLDVVPAANAFPEVPFVLPHFGSGFFRETLMTGAQCPNVHVDTSSSNSWLRTQPARLTLDDAFARALDVFGPGRILFGTDSNVFPAGWRRDRFEEQAQVLERLGLSEDDQQKIFAGNARRLLGLGG